MTITSQPQLPVVYVNGRYHYEEREENVLGQGAYGTVFVGLDKQTKENVAIKRVLSDKVKSNEIQILRSLNSDLVVGLRDVHDSRSLRRGSVYTYIIMDLCDTDLFSYLQDRTFDGRLNQPDIDVVTLGLANGYMELYSHDVIHRDIKPHNILITFEEQRSGCFPFKITSAKLSDFGISRVASPDASIKNIAGSPAYMAPEVGGNILDEQAYDAQVDMWSMGVVLYECLTGEVPFDESALCRMFLAVSSRSYPKDPLVSFPEATAEHYRDIVEALLQLDPSKRLTPAQFYAWANATIAGEDDHLSDVIEEDPFPLPLVRERQESIPYKIVRYLSVTEDEPTDKIFVSTAVTAFVTLLVGNFSPYQLPIMNTRSFSES